MNTYTLNRLIELNGKNNILVCNDCGSLAIQFLAWVDANDWTYKSDNGSGDTDDQWCEDCQEHVRFCTLEEFEGRMDKDISTLPKNELESLRKKWAMLPYLRKREIWSKYFNKQENQSEDSDLKKRDTKAEIEDKIVSLTQDLSINRIEETFRKHGIEYKCCGEKTDNVLEGCRDNYLKMRSYDLKYIGHNVFGNFFYSRCTEIICLVELKLDYEF